MAEQKTKTTEREYVIPLRRSFLKVQKYNRTSRAVKTIKEFIARHMKVPDRDLNKVKLDVYLNNDLWFKGRKNPPAKVKVKAVKEGDMVKVDFVDVPEEVKFLKAKHEKLHKAAPKSAPKPAKSEDKKEEAKDEKTDAEKKDEKEKEQSVAEHREKLAENKAKEEKHVPKMKDKNMPQQRKVIDRH